MITSLRYDATRTPHEQLVALSLLIQQALRRHAAVHAQLPRVLHETIPRRVFEEVLYDTLACEFDNLSSRLTLEVSPVDQLLVTAVPSQDRK